MDSSADASVEKGKGGGAADERLLRWIGATPILGASVFSKLSVPPFGGMGISIVIPLISAASALGLVAGKMVVDVPRFIAYAIAMSVLWGTQALRGESFSVLSLLMLSVVHFPYVLRLNPLPDYARLLDWFVKLALVVGILGLVQFSAQFVVGPGPAFPIESYMPSQLKVALFNPFTHLQYGSPYYRANGVVMLEPSFFSQFLAVAMVVEMLTRMRWAVLATLIAAIIVSYSGTGLVLVAVAVPLILMSKGRWDVLIVGAAAVILVLVAASFADVVFVRVFFARAGEFSATGSSGFARFVGGFYLFEQFLWPDPLRTLFGFGAGTVDDFKALANVPVSGTSIFFKMVFEFGLVGATAYFGFLACCFHRSRAPGLLKFVLVLTYALGGIYIPFSHALVFGLVLWPVSADPRGSAALADETPRRPPSPEKFDKRLSEVSA